MRRWILILGTFVFATVLAGRTQAQDSPSDAAATRAANLEADISYRIIGGTLALDKAWPWQIALFKRAANGAYVFQCGGSVIDKNWILTAAHCVYNDANNSYFDARDFFVLEDVTRIEKALTQNRSGRRLAVAQVIGHETYDAKAITDDIALLRLASPATSSPVTLNFPGGNALESPGSMVTVTGWGLIKPFNSKWEDFKTHEKIQAGDARYFTNRLMEVTIPLVDCSQAPSNWHTDRRQVCAGLGEGGKDSCRGDSGGPLVGRDSEGFYEQIGVVSFGAVECGRKGVYGVYSKVSAFENWIHIKTGIDFKKPEKPSPPVKPPAAPAPPIKPPPAPEPPAKPISDNKAGLTIGFVQGNTLKVGQSVQVKVTAQKSGYLLLLDITPDGRTAQIYPNARSLKASASTNRIEPNRPLLVPDRGNPYQGFEYRIDPPNGEGSLLAILSEQPLTSVTMPDLPKTMEKAETLEYLAGVLGELKRDLSVSNGAASEWSYVVAPYRIVR
jgi:secreted trypsin-like serine protease